MKLLASLVDRSFVPDQERVQAEGLQGSLATEQVASWFRSRCQGLVDTEEDGSQWAPWDDPDWPGSETWAPAARQSVALVPIDGDLAECLAITPDYTWMGNEYQWYDLDQVPQGGYLLRISATRTAWIFGRRADGSWRAYAFPNVK